MSDYHDGICDGHFNNTTITKHILCMGYYWPTIEHYCNEYFNKYVKYKQDSHLHHVPSQSLQPIQAMWPFTQWSFDLIDQFVPPLYGGYKFIITTIEYLTKWVRGFL